MAGFNLTSPSQSTGDNKFNGGLNNTAGPLSLEENQSSDLSNVDFDQFGSVVKRNGFYWLNATATTGTSFDIATKLLLHLNGTNGSTTLTDAMGNTVNNDTIFDSYTKLCMHFDNNATDSATAKTITNVGTTVTYSNTVVKVGSYSAVFNGTTAHYTAVDSSDWDLGTGNFTIAFWVKRDTVNSTFAVCAGANGADGYIFGLDQQGTYAYWDFTHRNSWTYTWDTNWHHVAFVRNGNSLSSYVDGVSLSTPWDVTGVSFNAPASSSFYIGQDSTAQNYVDGYLDEFCFDKGIARWTSNFTANPYPNGSATISTTSPKLGSGSGVFLSSGSSVSVADDVAWAFVGSDFTVDTWCKFISLNSAMTLLGQYADANNYWFLKKGTSASGNKLQMKFASASTTFGDYIMSNSWAGANTSTWYHLAFERTGTTGKIFINGVSQLLTPTVAFGTSSVGNIAAPLMIGSQSGTAYLDGNLDELRISNGVVRWVADFTPSTSEYIGAVSSISSDGLYWYEYNNAGTTARYAVKVSGGKFYKMDSLDGTWDDITGTLTIAAGKLCSFETFLDKVFVTNNTNPVFCWAGGTTAYLATVTSALTTAKSIAQYNNYLFLGNVAVASTSFPSRIYWSNLKNVATWDSADFIDVSKDDGQQITAIKTLADRLVIYKERAIYTLFYTGNADIPFVLPGGGKTNSSVGCIATESVREVENGHVFLSYDGLYYFDGNNSYKVSNQINKTFQSDLNTNTLSNAIAINYKAKNRYMISLTGTGKNTNDTIIKWDYYNNALSLYSGINAATMAIFYPDGVSETPYFGDYSGYEYRMDYGLNDYPATVKTAISAYYWTNWKHYKDIVMQKGVPHVYSYFQNNVATLTFAYAYDGNTTLQYSTTFNTTGGISQRHDLTGRGRLIRYYWANAATDETFRIDGLGTEVFADTNV